MDELIKKLIEVDKTARKSVENAAQSRVDAVRELDEKKRQLQKDNEQEFAEKSEKMKNDALSELEKAEKAIAKKEKAVAARLTRVFEESCEQWVSEAVAGITGS